jgi:seryl-tRNA synthetase
MRETSGDLVKENIPARNFRIRKLSLVGEVALTWTRNSGMPRPAAMVIRSDRNKTLERDRQPDASGKERGSRGCQEAQVTGTWTKDLLDLEKHRKNHLSAEIKKRMMVIPKIIDPSVPIGQDDSENARNRAVRRAGCAGF